MAGFEDLIRGALIKQGNTTREGREKIYNSARHALAQMTQKNTNLTPDMIAAQNSKLETAIAEIEASYAAGPSGAASSTGTAPAATPSPAAPAPATPAPAAPTPSVASPAAPSPQSPTPQVPPAASTVTADIRASRPGGSEPAGPAVAAPAAPGGRREPDFGAPNTSLPSDTPGEPSLRLNRDTEPETPAIDDTYRGNALKEKKPYAKLLLWTIILVGIAVAIWWAITFGPGLLREQIDGSVPNPGSTIESGSFVPDSGNAEDWTTVFLPDANVQNVVTNGSGAADLVDEGSLQVMRMASPDGTIGNNLLIKVPRGIMENLRGKAATFELTIKATNADSQEFVVFCEFSQMGNCGRKRFSAGANQEHFIFDVLINDAALAADEDAYLSVNTDFTGQGRSLDLYSIRVRASQ